MLHTNVHADFPFPGSIAEHHGQRGKVFQSLPGAICIFSPDGAPPRRVPVAQLVDPAAVDLDTSGLSSNGATTLKWLDGQLRGANSVIFHELKSSLRTASAAGQACLVDALTLAGLLKRLGWSRNGRERTSTGYITIWHRTNPETAL